MSGLSAAVAWLTGQEWFRKLVTILGLLLAVLLAIAGVRKQGEKAGRLIEREANRIEKIKVEKRVKEVEKAMEAVPRGDRSELAERLRGGEF